MVLFGIFNIKVVRGIEQILKSISLLILISFLGANQAWSQLYPLGAQYFHNQYLGNPSSAGIDSGYRFDLSNRVQWNDVPGAPVNQIFTGVLKTGKVGLGLNLTKASYVFHLEPWWNPSVENQATDRAHRIGQDKPIMVYQLVSSGTIEESIYQLQDRKAQLSSSIVELDRLPVAEAQALGTLEELAELI